MDFPADLKATVSWKERPLQDALEHLAKPYDLQYQVRDPRTLVVIREEKKMMIEAPAGVH